MATKATKKTETTEKAKTKKAAPKKRLSKIAQMWEKYPNGTIEILDMEAVLQ